MFFLFAHYEFFIIFQRVMTTLKYFRACKFYDFDSLHIDRNISEYVNSISSIVDTLTV